mmetsp:Transcript_38054/g.109792  ORF Transcript_38054/g.109792 Transcript_38054/m.109792 type:complete len:130 (+) Transcript_38054:654-1043(+)
MMPCPSESRAGRRANGLRCAASTPGAPPVDVPAGAAKGSDTGGVGLPGAAPPDGRAAALVRVGETEVCITDACAARVCGSPGAETTCPWQPRWWPAAVGEPAAAPLLGEGWKTYVGLLMLKLLVTTPAW